MAVGFLMLAVTTGYTAKEQPTAGKIENGLVIADTTLTAIPDGGWTLSVTVEPRNGFVPQSMHVQVGPNPENVVVLDQGPYKSPKTFTFDVECNLGPGNVSLLADAFDANRNFAEAAEVLIPLGAPGRLLKLTTNGPITLLESTIHDDLEVLAWYEGCALPRDVTDDSLTYSPVVENVVKVDENGRVTAVNVGETDIEIRKGDATVHVRAIVKGVWQGGNSEE